MRWPQIDFLENGFRPDAGELNGRFDRNKGDKERQYCAWLGKETERHVDCTLVLIMTIICIA
jgi:hypothetical protein